MMKSAVWIVGMIGYCNLGSLFGESALAVASTAPRSLRTSRVTKQGKPSVHRKTKRDVANTSNNKKKVTSANQLRKASTTSTKNKTKQSKLSGITKGKSLTKNKKNKKILNSKKRSQSRSPKAANRTKKNQPKETKKTNAARKLKSNKIPKIPEGVLNRKIQGDEKMGLPTAAVVVGASVNSASFDHNDDIQAFANVGETKFTHKPSTLYPLPGISNDLEADIPTQIIDTLTAKAASPEHGDGPLKAGDLVNVDAAALNSLREQQLSPETALSFAREVTQSPMTQDPLQPERSAAGKNGNIQSFRREFSDSFSDGESLDVESSTAEGKAVVVLRPQRPMSMNDVEKGSGLLQIVVRDGKVYKSRWSRTKPTITHETPVAGALPVPEANTKVVEQVTPEAQTPFVESWMDKVHRVLKEPHSQLVDRGDGFSSTTPTTPPHAPESQLYDAVDAPLPVSHAEVQVPEVRMFRPKPIGGLGNAESTNASAKTLTIHVVRRTLLDSSRQSSSDSPGVKVVKAWPSNDPAFHEVPTPTFQKLITNNPETYQPDSTASVATTTNPIPNQETNVENPPDLNMFIKHSKDKNSTAEDTELLVEQSEPIMRCGLTRMLRNILTPILSDHFEKQENLLDNYERRIENIVIAATRRNPRWPEIIPEQSQQQQSQQQQQQHQQPETPIRSVFAAE